ncbi:hypothetical protein [Thermococcus sp.]|uniref:hypothetical protein n=1 Tax=Thermococcus sp. TaxID=35749 RepID=UPI0026075464|nr:hypothetical protein [Thermococcus sp.]
MRLVNHFNDPFPGKPGAERGAFFTYPAGNSEKRLVVVIDETQYPAKADGGFQNTIQRLHPSTGTTPTRPSSALILN